MPSTNTLHVTSQRGVEDTSAASASVPNSIPSVSTKANARAIAVLARAARQRAAARNAPAAKAPAPKGAPNPLWAIAVAMAVFFGATALIMMI